MTDLFWHVVSIQWSRVAIFPLFFRCKLDFAQNTTLSNQIPDVMPCLIAFFWLTVLRQLVTNGLIFTSAQSVKVFVSRHSAIPAQQIYTESQSHEVTTFLRMTARKHIATLSRKLCRLTQQRKNWQKRMLMAADSRQDKPPWMCRCCHEGLSWALCTPKNKTCNFLQM